MKQIISKQLYLYIFATLNFCSTYFMRNCSSIYTQSHFTKLWVMSIFASRAYLHKYILHVCIYKLDHKYTNKTAESMTVLAKDSYSAANESKRQFNRFIIYCPKGKWLFFSKKKKRKKECKNERCRGSISRRLSVPYAIQSSNHWATGIATTAS